MGGERERISGAGVAGVGDRLRGVEAVLRTWGQNLSCASWGRGSVFSNESNGLCRIHEQFGIDVKPVGCRVFPFQIADVWR